MSLDVRQALDTSRSVVVEACAGSGKTWLLSSRIARALVEGVPSKSILALTFTNKAAAEMRNRVIEHLKEMASIESDKLAEKLTGWGFVGTAHDQAMQAAPSLFENFLKDPHPPNISTFHSWYVKLMAMAPLSMAGWSTVSLSRQPWDLRRQAWQLFYTEHAERTPYLPLVKLAGAAATRQAMDDWVSSRVEWRAFAQGTTSWQLSASQAQHAQPSHQTHPGPQADAGHQALLQAFTQNQAAVQQFYRDQAARAEMLAAAYQDADARGAVLFQVLSTWSADMPDHLSSLTAALLTLLDSDKQWASLPPVRYQMKWGESKFVRAADRKRWGSSAETLESELKIFVRALISLLDQNDQRLVQARTQALWVCSQALADCLDQVMSQSHEIDFSGLELAAWELLGGQHADEFHARLDTRIRHVLVDEFQDTNPVQWAMLKAWFGQYLQDDPSVRQQAPKVFLVGDPKQSIYRFRRADPQVFSVASEWLEENFQASVLRTDTTRRCASAIVSLCNASLQGLAPNRYAKHDTTVTAQGFVARLPIAAADGGTAWRAEGDQIAKALLQIQQVSPGFRWSQVRILTRTRTHMADYEAALQAAGIPFISDRSGGLLTEPEVLDILALLRTLAFPWSDGDLAHTLKSPVFDLSDAQLSCIAVVRAQVGPGSSLWQALAHCAQQDPADPLIHHAWSALTEWRRWSEQLPVHDLLDRIVHQQDLFDRVAQRFGGARGLQCIANLEAFIGLALDLDTARLPSLVRFLQEMDRWATAKNSEAPGPGPMPGIDALALTSLHSAKGLEADVVVLAGMLDREAADRGLRWLIHWNEARDGILGLQAWRQSDPFDATAIYALQDDRRQSDDEDFNLLYVGLTRAKKVLLLSAAQATQQGWYQQLASASDEWHPDLPLSEFKGPQFAVQLGQELALIESVEQTSLRTLPAGFWRGQRFPKREISVIEAPAPEALAIRQGKALHRLLEQGVSLRTDTVPALLAEFALPTTLRDQVTAAVHRIAQTAFAAQVFDSACLAYAEQEWPAAEGGVLRPDRVVRVSESPEIWWIVDFKWRVLPSQVADYARQLTRYQQAFAAIRPQGQVLAKILTSDAEVWALDGGTLNRLSESGSEDSRAEPR